MQSIENSQAGTRPPSPGSLRKRLKWLVSEFFEGNVRVAAEAWRVERMTVLRVIRGQVKRPRISFLTQVAQACGTTLDWLLLGRGAAPTPPRADTPLVTPALSRWREYVASLDLPDATRDALLKRPLRFRHAHSELAVNKTRPSGPIPHFGLRTTAEELDVRAWSTYLRGLVAARGPGRVRAALVEHTDGLRLDFNPLAIQLLILAETPGLSDEERRRWAREIMEKSTPFDVAFGFESPESESPGGEPGVSERAPSERPSEPLGPATGAKDRTAQPSPPLTQGTRAKRKRKR